MMVFCLGFLVLSIVFIIVYIGWYEAVVVKGAGQRFKFHPGDSSVLFRVFSIGFIIIIDIQWYEGIVVKESNSTQEENKQ